MALPRLPQCPEELKDIGEIRNDIRQIFDLLRQIKDDISQNNTRVAVQEVRLKHTNDTIESHICDYQSINSRVSRLEELKFEAKGFIYGSTKGAWLLLTGGTGAVAAAVAYLIAIWNSGGKMPNVGG